MLVGKFIIFFISIKSVQSLQYLRSCRCGQKQGSLLQSRISSNSDSDLNEFPWTSYLDITDLGNNKARCGGTLVSDRYDQDQGEL